MKRTRCALCETPFGADEVALVGEDIAVCADCTPCLTLQDVLYLTHHETADALLCTLGFHRHTV